MDCCLQQVSGNPLPTTGGLKQQDVTSGIDAVIASVMGAGVSRRTIERTGSCRPDPSCKGPVNYPEALSALIEEGAPTKTQDRLGGFSALHYATGRHANPTLANILIRGGADVDLVRTT